MSIGFSRLHDASFVIADGVMVLAVGKTVFDLELPNLSLNWKAEGDDSICFGIYEFQNGYLIHGEQCITNLQSDGTLAWQFSGEDIFVSPNGENVFEIDDGIIRLRDWNGKGYVLDRNGRMIK